MLHKILEKIDRHSKFNRASAHCDIPCKIYDPAIAQIAALTVIRLMDLINEISEKDTLNLADHAQLTRLVVQKEEHASKVKEEIRIIWGDYFKQAQFEQIPNTHELVHSIMLQASKCKQHIAREFAEDLLKLVNEFTAAFWLTKGVDTFSANCPYPPAETVIYPKLA